MQNVKPPESLIFEGQKFGLLTVGELIFSVDTHPKYLTTPRSYIQQGRIRECTCACGEIVLYSENALVVGKVKSCGCLKRIRREKQHTEKEDRESIKAAKQEIDFMIKQGQYRLKTVQSTPIHMKTQRVNLEEEWLGQRLRKLFALKGYANRKTVPIDTLSSKVRELREDFFVGQ